MLTTYFVLAQQSAEGAGSRMIHHPLGAFLCICIRFCIFLLCLRVISPESRDGPLFAVVCFPKSSGHTQSISQYRLQRVGSAERCKLIYSTPVCADAGSDK